jgi:hypothetical protein
MELLAKVDISDPTAKVYSVPAPDITLIGPKFDEILREPLVALLEGFKIDPCVVDVTEEEVGQELLHLRQSMQCMRRVLLGLRTGILVDGDVLLPNNAIKDGGIDDAPAVTLTELNLIDTSKLSWEHIIDIRSDANSARKLRNLRLFIHKEYESKDQNFLEDELSRLVEEYEETAKKLGAEVIEGSLGLVFDKDFVAGVTAGVGALLLGRVDLAAVAATPIVIKLGKIGIEFRRNKREFDIHIKNDPVAFLHDLKKISA